MELNLVLISFFQGGQHSMSRRQNGYRETDGFSISTLPIAMYLFHQRNRVVANNSPARFKKRRVVDVDRNRVNGNAGEEVSPNLTDEYRRIEVCVDRFIDRRPKSLPKKSRLRKAHPRKQNEQYGEAGRTFNVFRLNPIAANRTTNTERQT